MNEIVQMLRKMIIDMAEERAKHELSICKPMLNRNDIIQLIVLQIYDDVQEIKKILATQAMER